MRSFDPLDAGGAQPRSSADHLAELLLCPSETAAENLRAESVAGRVQVVGDVMVDVSLRWQEHAREDLAALGEYGLQAGDYLLLTAHRAGTSTPRAPGAPGRAGEGPTGEGAVPRAPAHPRAARASGLIERLRRSDGLTMTEPLGYLEFASLLTHARAVLSDSGGVQKEAYLAGVPCVTLRANTEWVETVSSGWNTLVDLDGSAALAALGRTPPAEHPPLYGDGHAAERCVDAILEL